MINDISAFCWDVQSKADLETLFLFFIWSIYNVQLCMTDSHAVIVLKNFINLK